MYCRKCNESIQKDWSYCPKCGNKVERIKINLSNTTVLREGTLRSLEYESYTCRDIVPAEQTIVAVNIIT